MLEKSNASLLSPLVQVELFYHGRSWDYEILAVLEFNSDRKRMSTICRHVCRWSVYVCRAVLFAV